MFAVLQAAAMSKAVMKPPAMNGVFTGPFPSCLNSCLNRAASHLGSARRALLGHVVLVIDLRAVAAEAGVPLERDAGVSDSHRERARATEPKAAAEPHGAERHERRGIAQGGLLHPLAVDPGAERERPEHPETGRHARRVGGFRDEAPLDAL